MTDLLLLSFEFKWVYINYVTQLGNRGGGGFHLTKIFFFKTGLVKKSKLECLSTLDWRFLDFLST